MPPWEFHPRSLPIRLFKGSPLKAEQNMETRVSVHKYKILYYKKDTKHDIKLSIGEERKALWIKFAQLPACAPGQTGQEVKPYRYSYHLITHTPAKNPGAHCKQHLVKDYHHHQQESNPSPYTNNGLQLLKRKIHTHTHTSFCW